MTDRVLNGKVALVTGAAGEIGTATIQLLAERGARIVAVDRDDAGLARAIGTLPASAEALSVVADVSLEQDVAAACTSFSTTPASRETSDRFRTIRSRRFAGCSTNKSPNLKR
jgi:NAD(P)-dependent dehydrogenase (short-subunit alcohol dehydrogenase family)